MKKRLHTRKPSNRSPLSQKKDLKYGLTVKPRSMPSAKHKQKSFEY